MTEHAMTFVHIRQEFQGRGARLEQHRSLVHTQLIPQMDDLQNAVENEGARVAQVTREHEHFSNDIGNSLGLCINEQEDLKERFRNLAWQVETRRGETTPGPASSENNAASGSVPPENSVTMVVKVEDLKNKVTRLIEQADHHNRAVSNFGPVMHQVDLIEGQIERWRHRLHQQLKVNLWMKSLAMLKKKKQMNCRKNSRHSQELTGLG